MHFQEKTAAASTRVSQLFFSEDVTSGIFVSHSEYKRHGQPDTTFATDNIVSRIAASERDRHILTVARLADGAMLASKVVTVTS